MRWPRRGGRGRAGQETWCSRGHSRPRDPGRDSGPISPPRRLFALFPDRQPGRSAVQAPATVWRVITYVIKQTNKGGTAPGGPQGWHPGEVGLESGGGPESDRCGLTVSTGTGGSPPGSRRWSRRFLARTPRSEGELARRRHARARPRGAAGACVDG
eukprot:scaffold3311_cov411-Prasinococcus_capsulatus_cf.AAC.14